MALNTVSLKNSLSVYLQAFTTRREVSTDTLNRHNEIVRKVDGVVEAFATQESNILGNRTLSDEGKSTAVATAATATAPKLAFLARVVRQLDDDKRATEATLFTVKPPAHLGSDPVLQYWYGKEIRDRFRGVTAQDQDIAFLKAAQTDLVDPDDVQAQINRDAILWAFQVTPGGPMLSAEIMRRALEERARRTNPETYARLQQVIVLHDSLNSLLDSVRGWLKGLGADPKKVYDELDGPPPTTTQIPPRMVAA